MLQYAKHCFFTIACEPAFPAQSSLIGTSFQCLFLSEHDGILQPFFIQMVNCGISIARLLCKSTQRVILVDFTLLLRLTILFKISLCILEKGRCQQFSLKYSLRLFPLQFGTILLRNLFLFYSLCIIIKLLTIFRLFETYQVLILKIGVLPFI